MSITRMQRELRNVGSSQKRDDNSRFPKGSKYYTAFAKTLYGARGAGNIAAEQWSQRVWYK